MPGEPRTALPGARNGTRMQAPEERLGHTQAQAIIERVIEHGIRRGLLDALRLSYQQAKDGSLTIHVPRHRGHFRIEPPGAGAGTVIRVSALGDEGGMPVGMVT